MEILHIQNPKELIDFPPSSVALGTFDGIHIGHQKVIQTGIDLAHHSNLKAGVLTFDPHPKEVLGKIKETNYITPLSVKLAILEKMGLDFTFIIPFNLEFAKLSPDEFIRQYIEGLNIRKVVTGFDFCFGHKGIGTASYLQEWAEKYHSFEAFMIPSIDEQGEKISSSRIRHLLMEGDVGEAAQLLGRYFRMSGNVVTGDQRGRTIGFPTANIHLNKPYIIPRVGVYAVKVYWKEQKLNGVLNLGFKPTFYSELEKPSLEVHIFNFDQSLYGEELEIEFISYLRPEKRFSGLDELKNQIKLDSDKAKEILNT